MVTDVDMKRKMIKRTPTVERLYAYVTFPSLQLQGMSLYRNSPAAARHYDEILEASHAIWVVCSWVFVVYVSMCALIDYQEKVPINANIAYFSMRKGVHVATENRRFNFYIQVTSSFSVY
jgi:uncharacterized membrane protein (DUF485 family)